MPQTQLTFKGKVIASLKPLPPTNSGTKMGKNGLIYSFKSKTKMLQNICFVKVQCVKVLCHDMRQQYVVFFITIQLNHLELKYK